MNEVELRKFAGAYGYIAGVNQLIAEVRRLQALVAGSTAENSTNMTKSQD